MPPERDLPAASIALALIRVGEVAAVDRRDDVLQSTPVRRRACRCRHEHRMPPGPARGNIGISSLLADGDALVLARIVVEKIEHDGH